MCSMECTDGRRGSGDQLLVKRRAELDKKRVEVCMDQTSGKEESKGKVLGL